MANVPGQRTGGGFGLARGLMYGAIILHVVGVLYGLYSLATGGPTRVVVACTVLALIGGFWVVWAHEQDQQDRHGWMFEKPPSNRAGDREFSDFADDTGRDR